MRNLVITNKSVKFRIRAQCFNRFTVPLYRINLKINNSKDVDSPNNLITITRTIINQLIT